MKHLLTTSAALGLMAGAAVADEKTLTISVYAFGVDAMNELVFAPFEEKCGCDIVVETGNSVERMAKIEANAADPLIDVVVMSSPDALQLARQGFLQQLDVSKIPSHTELYASAQDPIGDHYALGYGYYATSIVYRTDLVEIDSWGDLLSDELRGQVALPNITGTQGILALSMIEKSRGSDDISLTATIDAVGEHADDIVTFYSRSSELAQLMLQQEVIAAPVGRFAWSRFSGAALPFAWAEPVEGQAGGMNVMAMTANNGNEDLAYEFMNYWLSNEVQTRVAKAGIDSPANATVVVTDEEAEKLTYGADLINSLTLIDPADIIDNREGWLTRWNENVIN
ncbi:MAG: ABC transporter substrate-binding protein [Halocynthiibacter sp.]